MHPRIMTCLGAVVVVAGLVTATAGQAAPRSASPPTRTVAKSAVPLPHYKIRVIGVDTDLSSSLAIVSANGRYLVNNYADAIEYDTKTGTRIGEVEADNETVNGVDNSGTVVGSATFDGVLTAFSWHSGTYHYFPATPAVPESLGCGSPTGLESEFDGVSPQGTAVGAEFYNCGGPLLAAAISHPDASGSFAATGQNGSEAAGRAFIDSGDLAVGYAGNNNTDDQVVWNPVTNSAPVSVRTATGFPGLYPYQTVNYWNSSGEFLATGADDSHEVELIDGKKFTDIPTTGSQTGFVSNALGNNGIVVGSDGDITAEVWSPSLGIRTLKSLVSPTSESLLRALTVDSAGNIYGVGQAKDFTENYWEAQLVPAAPTVKIKSPKSRHKYKKGTRLKASYSCKAAGGTTLTSCKGSVADHHAISTKKVGKHTFTVIATDADGQKTKKTVHFTVKKT